MLELNVEQNPHSWLALHGLGVALIKHGDTNRALELFTSTAPLYPDGVYYEYVLNDLAYELQGAEENERALTLFQGIVKIFAESANAYDSLGEAYLKEGKTELAISNYTRSLELNPENANAKEVLKRLQEDGGG